MLSVNRNASILSIVLNQQEQQSDASKEPSLRMLNYLIPRDKAQLSMACKATQANDQLSEVLECDKLKIEALNNLVLGCFKCFMQSYQKQAPDNLIDSFKSDWSVCYSQQSEVFHTNTFDLSTSHKEFLFGKLLNETIKDMEGIASSIGNNELSNIKFYQNRVKRNLVHEEKPKVVLVNGRDDEVVYYAEITLCAKDMKLVVDDFIKECVSYVKYFMLQFATLHLEAQIYDQCYEGWTFEKSIFGREHHQGEALHERLSSSYTIQHLAENVAVLFFSEVVGLKEYLEKRQANELDNAKDIREKKDAERNMKIAMQRPNEKDACIIC